MVPSLTMERVPHSSTLMMIPSGKAGIVQTLRFMRDLVKAGKKSQRVREIALNLTADLPPKAWAAEIAALFFFVRDSIRFIGDVTNVETLHTADAVLDLGQGDCDDKSILLASLLESINHPTRFVAVGFFPDEFEHVLVETLIGSNYWQPLDPSEPVDPGWFPPNAVAQIRIFN